MAYSNKLNTFLILGIFCLLFSTSYSLNGIKSRNELDFKEKLGPRSKRSLFEGEINKYYNFYTSI